MGMAALGCQLRRCRHVSILLAQPPSASEHPFRNTHCACFAAQRGSHSEARAHLDEACQYSLTVLPALAQESYVRAYPHMMRLHMIQV